VRGNESQKADMGEFTAEIKKQSKPEDVRHWAAALVWVQLLQVLLTLVWALLNTGVASVLISGVVSVAFTFLCGFWVFWAQPGARRRGLRCRRPQALLRRQRPEAVLRIQCREAVLPIQCLKALPRALAPRRQYDTGSIASAADLDELSALDHAPGRHRVRAVRLQR